MNTIHVTTTILALASAAIAAEAPKPAHEAAAAFERIKALTGQWEAQVSNGKAQLTYEVVSGGNAVLERERMEGMPEMITVYHLDGERLLLTHYCVTGNQPRMQARHFNPQNGELKFEFLDATNMASPNAGHMRNVTLRLIDNDHFASTWEFYENGKPKATESAEYTRVH